MMEGWRVKYIDSHLALCNVLNIGRFTLTWVGYKVKKMIAKHTYVDDCAKVNKDCRRKIKFECSEFKQYSLKEQISIIGSGRCIGLLSRLSLLKRKELK